MNLKKNIDKFLKNLSDHKKVWIICCFIISAVAFFFAFRNIQSLKIESEKRDKEFKELYISSNALMTARKDLTKAAKIVEYAYKRGKERGSPLGYTSQILSTIGYELSNSPYYIAKMQHIEGINKKSIINSVVFSPNGTKILTASEDGTAILWSYSGKKIVTFKHGSGKSISTALFSPSGKRVITTSWDKTAIIWNLSGSLEKVLHHDGVVSFADFYLNKKTNETLIATSSTDRYVRVWNEQGGKIKSPQHGTGVLSVHFSPSGNTIVSKSRENSAIIWNYNTNKVIPLKHGNKITFADFSKNGSFILTTSEDSTAKTWELNGSLIKTFYHGEAITTAAIAPNEKYFVTASNNGIFKIWSTNDDKSLIKTVNQHAKIESIAISPDSKYLAVAYNEKVLKIFDFQGNLCFKTNEFKSNIKCLQFAKTNSHIVTAESNGNITLWALNCPIFSQKKLTTAKIKKVSLSADKKTIMILTQKNTISILDEYWSPTKPIKIEGEVFVDATLSPSGRYVAIVSHPASPKEQDVRHVFIWDIKPNSKICFDKEHLDYINNVKFSTDSKIILTFGSDNAANIFDQKGRFLFSLSNHPDWVSAGSFAHNRNIIATGTRKGTIHLWNGEDGQLKEKLEFEHKSGISSIEFSPNDDYILTASWDGTCKLINHTYQIENQFGNFNQPVISARFSDDGKYIVVFSKNNIVKLFNIKCELLAIIENNNDDIEKNNDKIVSATISNKNDSIITVTQNGTVNTWFSPDSIYHWLRNSEMPSLTEKELESLNLKLY